MKHQYECKRVSNIKLCHKNTITVRLNIHYILIRCKLHDDLYNVTVEHYLISYGILVLNDISNRSGPSHSYLDVLPFILPQRRRVNDRCASAGFYTSLSFLKGPHGLRHSCQRAVAHGESRCRSLLVSLFRQGRCLFFSSVKRKLFTAIHLLPMGCCF